MSKLIERTIVECVASVLQSILKDNANILTYDVGATLLYVRCPCATVIGKAGVTTAY